MNASPSLSPELVSSWNASYQAAVRSPILSALRLAAADVDALARVVANRCVMKASRTKERASSSGGTAAARGEQKRRA